MDIGMILAGVLSALVIAFTTYATKLQKGESFNVAKIGRTLAVGLVLGVLASFTGYELTAENWQAYAAANAGLIAVIDQVLKLVFRLVQKPQKE